MSDVTTHLSAAKLQTLIDNWDDDKMNSALVTSLATQYPPSKGIIEAISEAFTVDLPAAVRTGPAKPLSDADRERILIALLAARGERLNLAVHIYFALGLGISPHEVVHILLLTGMYAGLPAFASALDVVRDTFVLLETLPSVPPPDPLVVLPALQIGFALPPPQP